MQCADDSAYIQRVIALHLKYLIRDSAVSGHHPNLISGLLENISTLRQKVKECGGKVLSLPDLDVAVKPLRDLMALMQAEEDS